MTVTVVKTIGTGGDYSTLQAWEDACPADLVSADQVWRGEVKNQEFTSSGDLLTISGITTDSTRYVELTTAAGASFADNANKATNALRYNASNGAALKVSGTYGRALICNVAYTRISKLQFWSESGSNYYGVSFGSSVVGTIFDSCIVSGDKWPLFSNSTIKVKNCAVIKRGNQAQSAIASFELSANIINSTFACISDAAPCPVGIKIAYQSGSSYAKNVAVFGATAPEQGTWNNTTCYTDVATPPTGFTQATYANQFENTTNSAADFRLKSGSALIDSGTTDATNAPTDIIGTTRTSGSYDVGAWEFYSGGGGGASAHLFTAANSQQVNTASSAAVRQSGNGTITLPALKDWGTGNLKTNESGVTIIINNATTGALVSLLTGQTTNASGVLPTLTGLVSGMVYRITTILADGSEGTWKYTAA